MKNYIQKSSSYIQWLIIIAIAFTFTAAAAMALDESVTHTMVGVTAFSLGIVLTFTWIMDSIIKSVWKTYKEMRGEEKAQVAALVFYAIFSFVVLLTTIVALSIH